MVPAAMTRQSWLLTDVEQGVYLADLELGPTDFTGDQVRGLRVRKHVLRGRLSEGVDVVEIENGAAAGHDPADARHGHPPC